MSNLLDTVKALITPALTKTAATSLGENEASVSKALDSILPIVLNGMVNSKSEHHAPIAELVGKISDDTYLMKDIIADVSNQADSSVVMGLGGALTSLLLGSNVSSISNLVSNHAGIKSSSTSSLFNTGSLIAASFLGNKMKAEGLSFNSILGWLGQHKDVLTAAIPNGFSSFTGEPDKVKNTNTSPVNNIQTADDKKRNKWVFPVLLLALLGIGLFWWMKGCNNTSADDDKEATAVIDSAGASINDAVEKAAAGGKIDTAVNTVSEGPKGTVDEAGNWIVTKGEPVKLKLDNGIEIDAFKGSLEDRLYAFIKDPGAMPGKDTWFSFDDLLFESNKSTLKNGYEKQLANTCEILKAYPEVKIKLGGYTDNTGDSVKNVTLSASRAKAVYTQMLNKGAGKTSFDEKPYEGYGSLHPVADNATPEGRAQNRRISLSVRAK